MGDFQDVFGAGADSVSLMNMFQRQEERLTARENALRRAKLDDDERSGLSYEDELEAWRSSMSSRGYTKGPAFSTYEELAAWDRSNIRPHVRRRNGQGFEVFFTDKAAAHSVAEPLETGNYRPNFHSPDDPPF